MLEVCQQACGSDQVGCREACKGKPAAGVTITASTADELTLIFCQSDEQPEGAVATDTSGRIVLGNLPAGGTVLTAR